jgi:hypothetical protein
VLATWSERLSGELLYPYRYRHSYLNGIRSAHFLLAHPGLARGDSE